MFSGIVEEAAQVVALQADKGNLHLTMRCSFVDELKIDQSVAHNGVCLTVVSKTADTYTVTAVQETLERSNLGKLKVGDKVNLERSMLPDTFTLLTARPESNSATETPKTSAIGSSSEISG